MKKTNRIILLLIVKDVLIFILGAALAIRAEYGGFNGTVLVLPLAILLIMFGWIWRGLCKSGKK